MPSADDKVVLSLQIEVADAAKEIKKVKAQLEEVRRIEGRTKTNETRDLRTRQRTAETDHKTKLRNLKDLEALRKKGLGSVAGITKEHGKQNVLLKSLDSIQTRIQTKYQKWLKQNQQWGPAGVVAKPALRAGRAAFNVGSTVVSGLLGMLIGGIQQGYQTHLQVGQAMAPLAGMGARPGQIGIGKGIGMGYGPSQTYRHAAGVGRATGDPGAVTLAQQFAMGGGGMDVGEATGIMGSLRQAGVGFSGKENQESAAKLLGQMVEGGIITGLEKARLPEYLKGVASMAQTMGGRQTGKVDVGSIANTLSYLGRIPGMQGQRGVNLMQTLDQSIRSPGGGEAGQQVMLQAFGFGKPGGETSYYDAMKRQQRGAQGAGGAQNIMDVFKELYSQYGVVGGGGSTQQQQEANLAINTAMPGLNLDMIEGIGDMINNGENQEEILKKIAEATKAFKPIEDRVVDAINEGFSSVAKRIAGQEAKSAGIGAKAAKLVEDVQDLQYKILQELVKIMKENLPEIKLVLGVISDTITSWLGGRGEKNKVSAKSPASIAAAAHLALPIEGETQQETLMRQRGNVGKLKAFRKQVSGALPGSISGEMLKEALSTVFGGEKAIEKFGDVARMSSERKKNLLLGAIDKMITEEEGIPSLKKLAPYIIKGKHDPNAPMQAAPGVGDIPTWQKDITKGEKTKGSDIAAAATRAGSFFGASVAVPVTGPATSKKVTVPVEFTIQSANPSINPAQPGGGASPLKP